MSKELIEKLREYRDQIAGDVESNGRSVLIRHEGWELQECLTQAAARIADLETIVSRLTNEKAQAEIGAAAWKRAFDNSTIEDIDVGLCDSCHSEVLHVSPGEPVWCKRCVAAGKVGQPAAEAARTQEQEKQQ